MKNEEKLTKLLKLNEMKKKQIVKWKVKKVVDFFIINPKWWKGGDFALWRCERVYVHVGANNYDFLVAKNEISQPVSRPNRHKPTNQPTPLE